MLARLKGVLPLVVMILGILTSDALRWATPAIPYIISTLLLLTFIDLRLEDLRLRWSHLALLVAQLGLCILAYLVGKPLGEVIATAMMMCALTPSATAGPVIVRLLGGDVGYTTSYVLLSHLMLVVVAPIALPLVSPRAEAVNFASEALPILEQVLRLIAPPMALAVLMRKLLPKLTERVRSYRGLSYRLWLVSLVLLMSHTMGLIEQCGVGMWSDLVPMLLVAVGMSLGQFLLGHYLASPLGVETSALRHAFAQKNTTLAIWLSSLFLSPSVALASAAYILCQNVAIAILVGRRRSS